MTSADDGIRRRPSGFLLPYAEILRIPRAWEFSVAGIIGRMPMSMAGLGMVLLISASTGRYAVAGSVSAASSLGMAACGPQFGRLIDRYGQGRVIVPMAMAFAAGIAGLILAVELGAPSWTYFPPGVVAGATMPALGPMSRARWRALLAGSPRLHTAFSLESVADELCFVVGPASVTVLATQVDPAAGVCAAAVLCLAGTLWFASQRETEPLAASPHPPPERLDSGRGTRRARLASPALAILMPVYVFLGAMFVTIDLSTVAFATDSGHKDLAGFVLGTYALGSASGGLWYGARTWKAPAERRLAVTLTLTVAGVCTFWAMRDLAGLTALIFLCGLTIAPTLIAGYSLLESTVQPGRTTEAMSWLSTGIYVGVGAGSTAAGFILDALGTRYGYVFAACCGSLAVALYLVGLFRTERLRSA
ncbi:MAG TPA: MFS transporter [Trebonia sp.]|jgi:predicted MFS family arabinose efflux permease|nr:MFS transporter [Trebonia sp.]